MSNPLCKPTLCRPSSLGHLNRNQFRHDSASASHRPTALCAMGVCASTASVAAIDTHIGEGWSEPENSVASAQSQATQTGKECPSRGSVVAPELPSSDAASTPTKTAAARNRIFSSTSLPAGGSELGLGHGSPVTTVVRCSRRIPDDGNRNPSSRKRVLISPTTTDLEAMQGWL